MAVYASYTITHK